MRDIRGDLQERAKATEEEVQSINADYEKRIEQLQTERAAKVAKAKMKLEMKMGRDSTSRTLHLGRHCHGSQRQPARLRHSIDPLCNRHCTVRVAHRRLQSSIYG
jgi:hypothetical protein